MSVEDTYTFILLLIMLPITYIWEENNKPNEEELRWYRLLRSAETINAYCAEKLDDNCNKCIVRELLYCKKR